MFGDDGNSMRLALQLCCTGAIAVALVIPSVAWSQNQAATIASHSVLDEVLSGFSGQGTFPELLAKLGVEIRPGGIIGLEAGPPSDKQITVSLEGATTVRQVLTALCAAEQAHRFVLAADRRIVNVLLTRPDQVSELLAFQVAAFDMSLDAWPMNWYSRIPEFGTDIQRMLADYYRPAQRMKDLGGANLETNLHPPNVDLHLKNVTILQILNALGTKELDWASHEDATAPRSRGVSVVEFPLGWEVQLPPSKSLPFNVWMRSVFRMFPPSGHS